MIIRLPRYAEIKLQSLCAEAGALCHSVDEDESGWDRLVEFPEREFSGPADMRQPRVVAYVQVKSSGRRLTKCRIKLSNALRAALSRQPWFVMLVAGNRERGEPKVFAVHVWEELICRTLRAVRAAEAEGRSLHKHYLTISFQSTDQKDARLVHWMQEEIDAIGPEYEMLKGQIVRSSGYEDGYGSGSMMIEADSEEEILENLLGLGSGLRVRKFTFTPSRFGISAAEPQIDESDGVVRIAPNPIKEVDIQLVNLVDRRKISFHGHVYASEIPSGEGRRRLFRFSCSIFEIVAGENSSAKLKINISSEKKMDLEEIEKLFEFREFLERGPFDIQVWSNGKRISSGGVRSEVSSAAEEWRKLAQAVRLLRSAAGSQKVKVSLSELRAAPGLRTIAEIAAAPSFRVEIDVNYDAPVESITSIIYWCKIEIGEYAYFSLNERSVVEDIYCNDRRIITADQDKCIESFFKFGAMDDDEVIERDYEASLERLKQSGTPLPLSNLIEYIAAIAQGDAQRRM